MLARRLLPALLVSSVVLGGSALVPRAAWAAPDDSEAEALIAKGIELREKGKDDEALAVFKQALGRSPTPRARAQVALAEQALGLWVAADTDLALALDAKTDPWITKNRGALEGALASIRRHLGSLEVRGTEGAEVTLDGVKLGTLPAASPYRVEAGRRTLELRAKGYYPTTRTLEIPAGGTARETVNLVVMQADVPAPSASAATSAGGSRGERSGDNGGGGGGGDPGKGQRLLGWVFTGAGGALLVTGGVSFLVRKGIIDDYNIQCPGVGSANQSADCRDKEEATKTWLYVGVSTLIAGGLLTVGGLTLVATAPSSSSSSGRAGAGGAGRRESRAILGCAPGTFGAGGGLFCTGSF